MTSFMRHGLVIAMFALTAVPVRAGAIRTADFGTDPGWVAVGSGSNQNNFGYRSSAFAGGQPGEAGGRFTRSSFERYYGDTALGGSLGLAVPLHGSGLFDTTAFNFPDFGPGLILGHFDTASSAAIGLIFNNTPSGGLYADAIVRFADGSEVRTPVAASLLPNVDRTWSYDWNPDGGSLGEGQLAVSLSGSDGGTATVDLSATDRLSFAEFDGFGLSGGPTPSTSGNPNRPDWYADVFIDNVSYSVAVPVPSSAVLLGIGAPVLVAYWRRCRRLGPRN